MASDVPEIMLACQVVEFDKSYEINTVPAPKPALLEPYDLLIRVAVASLCHTDLMVIAGDFKSPLPLVGSHEGAGTVVAMGSSVSGWHVGDRVMCGVTTYRCGTCPECTGPEERTQYCISSSAPGIHRNGAFAEYMVADSRESQKLRRGVAFEDAAPLACAGRTIYRAIIQADLRPGQWLGLVGSGGGLGHLGVQFGRALGLRVLGVDARAEGLTLSREMGAEAVLDAREGKKAVVRRVRELTDGSGCGATVNVSDAASAAGLACAITAMHGKMIQVAQPREVCIPFEEFIFRDLKVEGSMIASAKQGDDMLEVIAKHGIRVRTNVFHGLKQVPDLVEALRNGKIQGKGIVIVDEEAVRRQNEPNAIL